MNYKTIGLTLIILAVLIFSYVAYHNSQKRQQAIIFSKKLMLSALWDTYKRNYWDPNSGRTLDKQRNGITTSEGQSYTMLRAVWQDDKPTFDKTWSWTEMNLKRPSDHLFSWLYGQKTDGSFGIISQQGGQNTATDADTDIALALAFAGQRWGNADYLQASKDIIGDIWQQEVVTINGTPYVVADNVEKNSPNSVLINPSYLAPYAYRLFAQLDPQHNWNAVIDSSYKILDESSKSPLDKASSAGLPPDWLVIDKQTGDIATSTNPTLTTNFGFDALRVPWRLAVDWQWYKDPRDKSILDSFNFLDREWQDKKMLDSTYTHDGQVVYTTESPSFYGGIIGYFIVSEPQIANDVYKNKLELLYSPDLQSWKQTLGYYDDNWAWFGLSLFNGQITNLIPLNTAKPQAERSGLLTPLGILSSN